MSTPSLILEVRDLPPLEVRCECGNVIDVNRLRVSQRRCPLCVPAVRAAVDAAAALR